MSKHFEDKEALDHVLEKRAEGVLTISESHGTELPGYWAAALDSGKEMAIVTLLLGLILSAGGVSQTSAFVMLITFGFGWLIWKTGRSGWLGWSRLERMHRLIEQEKYEVTHHRPQEREELVALYGSKGFEGKLLDDVVDVLMADQDRLLKVMLEEEMGLTLQAYEHPIQQTFGACVGSFISLVTCLSLFYFIPRWGMPVGAFSLVAIGSALSAHYEKNKMIQAIVWNISIAALCFGAAYFLYHAL